MTKLRRLIEVDLPIKEISQHARRDQNIRKGHLHSMHVWWATRPLASCRAVVLATLLPDPVDSQCPQSFRTEAARAMGEFAHTVSRTRELNNVYRSIIKVTGDADAAQRWSRYVGLAKVTESDARATTLLRDALLAFVSDFAAWDAGIDTAFLSTARRLVAAAHPEGGPLVLDPFSGAGSIPFEVLRVGANAFAADLNPIPVLMNKVALEYLPKYGQRLVEGVEKWGNWVLDKARERLGHYYPADDRGHNPIAYIWARKISCEGPGCGVAVPLLGMLWISNKRKNLVALRYRGDRDTKQIHVTIFYPKSASELQPGIVNRMSATCPCCGHTTPYKRVREQLQSQQGGTHHAQLIAVVTLDENGNRRFRLPEKNDWEAAERADDDLAETKRRHHGPLSWVPEEAISRHEPRRIGPLLYGMERWCDMYLPRQALVLREFCYLVSEAREQILNETNDATFSDAVVTCLALTVSNSTQFNCATSYWSYDHMQTAFTNNGMAMKPDFAEANPLMPKLVGSFEYSHGQMLSVLEREATQLSRGGVVQQSSATHIPLPDHSVCYLVTDPPYYDAVPYSALADFCYVWQKRMLRSLYPDTFRAEVTTNDAEIVVDRPHQQSTSTKGIVFYERELTAAFRDCRRVLTPSGVSVVMFASKTTKAWEATLRAIVDAGFVISASWPIDTERAARMQARNRAVLGSTIHLVCRPRDSLGESDRTTDTGDWREVLDELPRRIQEWMPRLSREGVVGADAIFSCLGPALEIFSRYSRVEKASGEQVTLRDYLEHVWAAVSQEALRMVFEGADASGFEEDARLTAMWLWTLGTGNEQGGAGNSDEVGDEEGGGRKELSRGYALEFDAARKIAQGLGAHLEELPSVVEVKGDVARLLAARERASALFGKEQGDAPPARRKKGKQLKLDFEEELEQAAAQGVWGETGAPKLGTTTLDRVHQSMILFGAGRSEALRRFLVDEGAGADGRFWTLAQALAALYPAGSDEKRWIDGVLARKKNLGF